MFILGKHDCVCGDRVVRDEVWSGVGIIFFAWYNQMVWFWVLLWCQVEDFSFATFVQVRMVASITLTTTMMGPWARYEVLFFVTLHIFLLQLSIANWLQQHDKIRLTHSPTRFYKAVANFKDSVGRTLKGNLVLLQVSSLLYIKLFKQCLFFDILMCFFK
jgi:hypothetical protein